jgi:hypothetical protein
MSTEMDVANNPEAAIDRILSELEKGVDELPRGAMLEAREHRREITPRLIEATRRAAHRAAS